MPEKRINQRSKMTGYLLDRCDDVLLSTEERRDLLVSGLGKRRGEHFDDGTVARHDESVAMYTGWLTRDRSGLETAEYALVDATAELVFYRGERDDSMEEARQAYLGLRDAFEGLFDQAAAIGFARLTPEKPWEMLDHTSHLVVRLRGEAEVTRPELRPRFNNLRLTAADFADALEPSVERLRAALDGFDHWSEQVVITRALRDDAKAKLRRTLKAVEDSIKSLFRLADLDELAERVVSARIRRRGKRRRSAQREKAASTDRAVRAAPSGPPEPPLGPRRLEDSVVPFRPASVPESASGPDRPAPSVLPRVVQRE